MDLVIALSNKIYLKLEENKDLRTIDEITTKYESAEDLINSSKYHSKIEDFYISYKNYIDKIEVSKNPPGTIKIYTYNPNLYNINVLYRKNKNKMNTRRLIGGIEKSLKNYIDIKLILTLSKKCSFFIDSKYNYKNRGLARIKNSLYYANSINDSVIKNYNQLIKIIKNELLDGYNKETKEPNERTYNYARYIDSYLESKGITTVKPLERLKINKEKIKTISKPKLNENLPQELIGKGTSYLLDYIEETRNDTSFSEEEYIINIDDFSFEEEDDEKTWFK